MAVKKAEEIAELARIEEQLIIDSKDDQCPACGLATRNLIYINPQFLKLFGVVECTGCGCWYSPMSIRKQKLALSKANLAAGPISV